jgi:phage repressor protein C with HTH and peptisase S24 domain
MELKVPIQFPEIGPLRGPRSGCLNFDQPMLHASGESSADAPIVRPRHILAFEIPDDSMHPRAMKGEFAIIEGGEHVDAKAGDEVLVQLADGRCQVRTLVRYLDATVTLR